MLRHRLRPLGLFAVSSLLFWAALGAGAAAPPATTVDMNALLRIVLPSVFALAALAWPRQTALVALFVSPLLPVVMRAVLDMPSVSVGEHLLLGTMTGATLRLLFCGTRRDGRALLPAALLAFEAVVVVSFATVAYQYAVVGVPPLDLIAAPLRQYFAPQLIDFMRDDFLVVHHTLLWLIGGAWFYFLSLPEIKGDGHDLAASLIAGAATACLVGVAQSIWQFAPIDFFMRVQPDLFRVSATLQDPNTFGVYLASLLPLGVVMAVQSSRPRTLAVGWIGLSGFCLIQSVSRSSWIGAVASLVLGFALAWRAPSSLGLRARPVWLRAVSLLLLGVVCAVLATSGIVTFFDLGRDVDRRAASSAADMAIVSMNVRRPIDEVLPARSEHWGAALALWRDYPAFGAGIGRYALMKLRPIGGVLDASTAGESKRIAAGGPGKLERWLNGTDGSDFAAADVLPDDTIESADGSWGPITILARWSATQLVLENAAPRGVYAYVIRHPDFDLSRRPHAHRAAGRRLPMWTTAHNNYLGVLAELGAVGLLVFLCLPMAIFIDARRAQRQPDPPRRALATAAALGLFAVSVAALAQDPLVVKEMHHVLWALAALILPAAAGSEPAHTPE